MGGCGRYCRLALKMTLFLIVSRTVSATCFRPVAFVPVRQRLLFNNKSATSTKSSGFHHASNPLQKNDNEYTTAPTEEISSNISIPMIPPREHGYRLTPFSWSELQQIIVEEQDLAKLSRSVEQEETYLRFRQELLQEYASVYDHILHSKFGYPKRLDDQTPQRWEAYPPSQQQQPPPPPPPIVVLVPNDFPYHTESGIEHWVLWKLHEKVNQIDIDQAKEDLRQRLGDDVDLIHWENPPHLKSLPDIDHVHILVRRRKQ